MQQDIREIETLGVLELFVQLGKVRKWKLKMFIDVCLEENFERKRQVAVHVVEGFERPWEEGEGAHVGSRKKKMKCFKFSCLSFCYCLSIPRSNKTEKEKNNGRRRKKKIHGRTDCTSGRRTTRVGDDRFFSLQPSLSNLDHMTIGVSSSSSLFSHSHSIYRICSGWVGGEKQKVFSSCKKIGQVGGERK
ncbi:hypothetical protein P8452_27356 [Trifolium repens]|nr:hypothetical protein P8452_27356 [Trifolium repens]